MEFGLLAWSWPPEPSGLAVAAREIALSVAAAGATVRVFTLDRPSGAVSREDGIEILGCAPGPLGRRLRRLAVLGHLAAPFAFWRAVRRAHRIRPFDLVEATNWYAPGLLVSMLGPPPLATRHSTPAGTATPPPRDRRGRIDLAFARSLERRAARGSIAHLSNTIPHAAHVAALYGIPAPPDPRHAVLGLSLPPELLSRAAAAPHPSDVSPFELLFIGRNTPRKGADALLAAVSVLAAEAERGAVPEFRLRAVGLRDADLLALPAAARRRIAAIPAASESEKLQLLSDAHAVLAPSRYESFGLVYQEALAFGRPLLACAEDPSAASLLADAPGRPGPALLAPRCDPADLLPPLRRLLREPELRALLRESALRAANRFDRRSLGAGTLLAYAAVVSPGLPPDVQVRPSAGSPAADAATGSDTPCSPPNGVSSAASS